MLNITNLTYAILPTKSFFYNLIKNVKMLGSQKFNV